MRIITDSTPVEDAKDPADSYIVMLYKLVASPDELGEMEDAFRRGGQGYGHFKKQLLEKLLGHFSAMRSNRAKLEQDGPLVEEVLSQGARQARAIARKTLDRVRKAVGL